MIKGDKEKEAARLHDSQPLRRASSSFGFQKNQMHLNPHRNYVRQLFDMWGEGEPGVFHPDPVKMVEDSIASGGG